MCAEASRRRIAARRRLHLANRTVRSRRRRGPVLPSRCVALRYTTILKSYSTSSARGVSRVTYWNDLVSNVLWPLEVRPADRESFDAAFSTDTLGPALIAKTFSRPATIEHTDKHVAQSGERRVLLLLTIEGRVSLSNHGREALLEEGDFVLSDSFAPSRTILAQPNHALSLCLPYDALTAYIPNPEAAFGLRMPGDHGFGHTVNMMLRSVWAQVERGLPARFGPTIARNLLEMVAAAYALEHDAQIAESSLASGRRCQVKRFIETHLRDSDLAATTIGSALGVSPRYVRMVFTAEHESVSDYILRRRLEECALQLTSVLWLGRSITETAFDWGFCSMAHFTRAFKERFALTPTQYRRLHGSPHLSTATN